MRRFAFVGLVAGPGRVVVCRPERYQLAFGTTFGSPVSRHVMLDWLNDGQNRRERVKFVMVLSSAERPPRQPLRGPATRRVRYGLKSRSVPTRVQYRQHDAIAKARICCVYSLPHRVLVVHVGVRAYFNLSC
jgi:hypothetical protein